MLQGRIIRTGTMGVLLTLILLLSAQCVAPAPAPAPAAAPAVQPEPTAEPAPAAAPTVSENPFAEGCWEFPTEPLTIEIWWHEYAPFTAYMNELVERYQTLHPNITLDVVVASQADLNQKLAVAVASGTGPDVIDQDISYFTAFHNKGILDPIDLNVFCSTDPAKLQGEYLPGVLEGGLMFDGTIFGLPFQANSFSLFINTDAYADAGLDPVQDAPKTWDELKEVGAKLNKTEGDQTVRKGYDFAHFSPRWILIEFQPLVEQFGGTLLNEDQTQCQLNAEPAVKALELWRDVSATAGDPKTTLNTPAQSNQDLIDGRVAMWQTGPWATNQLLDSSLGDHWTVTRLPQVDPANPHTLIYGFAWGVNDAKPDLNKQVAWDFIRFTLMHPEEWLSKATFIQPRANMLDIEGVSDFPFIDVHLQDIESGSWLLRSEKTNEIAQILGRAVERVVFEGADPQASLDTAQDECANALAD